MMSIPESESELILEIKYCLQNNIPYKMLGNGSNLLISDDGVDGFVINNKKACVDLFVHNDLLYCGSSVMMQQLINYCINNEFYAMEYLYSVPATVGGAVVQNAGRGKQYNKQISDYIVKVKVFDGEKIREIPKRKCRFGFRDSVFKENRDLVVLGVCFALPMQSEEIGVNAKKERMKLVRKYQDSGCANFGTVFSTANHHIMKLLRGVKIGNAGYSKKTPNWICNYGDAKAKDIVKLIKVSKLLHKFLFRSVKAEVETW